MSRACQVRFAGIRPQLKCRLDGRIRKRQTRRSMVVTEEIELVVNPGKLAIRLEKHCIMRDSLVQQIGRLQQIPSLIRGVVPGENQILGATVEIESDQIGRWCVLDG